MSTLCWGVIKYSLDAKITNNKNVSRASIFKQPRQFSSEKLKTYIVKILTKQTTYNNITLFINESHLLTLTDKLDNAKLSTEMRQAVT